MKSGLEGRNNVTLRESLRKGEIVSMKSGLEGRNNAADLLLKGDPEGASQ